MVTLHSSSAKSFPFRQHVCLRWMFFVGLSKSSPSTTRLSADVSSSRASLVSCFFFPLAWCFLIEVSNSGFICVIVAVRVCSVIIVC